MKVDNFEATLIHIEKKLETINEWYCRSQSTSLKRDLLSQMDALRSLRDDMQHIKKGGFRYDQKDSPRNH